MPYIRSRTPSITTNPHVGRVDYRPFNHFKAHHGSVDASAANLRSWVNIGREFGKTQGAFHHLLTVVMALLGVEVEDGALIIRELRSIA